MGCQLGRLSSTAARSTLVACGLGPHTFRASCETAHGLRAGGLIAVLGGLRAERRPVVATDGLEFADRMITQVSLMIDALRDFIDEQKRDNSDVAANPIAAWEAFVNEHPELEREPLSFTDTELLRALREANRSWDRRRPRDRRGQGVWSSLVADVLVGVTFMPGEVVVPKELRPTQSDTTRVGVALARLTRDGRVLRTSRKWETNRWAPTPKGGRDDAR
jgi:hypothetical protein